MGQDCILLSFVMIRGMYGRVWSPLYVPWTVGRGGGTNCGEGHTAEESG